MAAKFLALAAVILGHASAESSGMSQMVSIKKLLAQVENQTPEDAVMNLVLSKAEAAFGATPFGTSVKKIVDMIDKEMFPKVLEGHKADQTELNDLAALLKKCGSTKSVMIAIAEKSKTKYLKFSPLHKTCRTGEAGLYTTKQECYEELSDRKKIMDLKCKIYANIDAKLGNQNSNRQIVKKGGSEATETYLNRLSQTFCGSNGGCGAKCGSPQCGFRCTFQCAKIACEKATKDHAAWTLKCKKIQKQYDNKVTECNNLQDQMDGAACKRAVDMKDACETYAECYMTRHGAYEEVHKVVKGGRHAKVDDAVTGNELDRHAEWRGLKRMQCLMTAFMDGKVEDKEIETCKKKIYSIDHLKIKYPELDALVVCSVPKLYPTTGEYKKAEFAPLPVSAKGKEDANECTGVLEVSTTPAPGSPASCKCERLTLNGPYSPGPMVKCSNCLDVRKSTDKDSCPTGTKVFAPRSRDDWKTFLSSAQPLRAPHWIIDVTRPQNGCGGCTKNEMNSENSGQKSWVTGDGAPWWLRSTRYNEPNGDYHANCYLDLWQTPKNEDSVTWNDGNCNYHSKSYYCQLATISLKPKSGSPGGCMCETVALTGKYSPGALIKCKGCLDVSKSTQKNSCPMGTKIFAPRTRDDWKTFIDSATPLRSPHWIIDVTRPANGCGGCTRNAMNSDNAAQKTWRTSDGTPWWLRSTTYNEPNGDYNANCYLDLWHNPPNENSVTWNDGRCNYHANSYYCQLAKKKAPAPPPPAPAPPPYNAVQSTGVKDLSLYSRMNDLGQAQAQATCTGLLPLHTSKGSGWAFAVQRSCGGGKPTCAQVCGGITEGQAKKLQCFNSLHIYANKPTGKTGSVGLKTYIYGGCGGGCGPNYCCCFGPTDSKPDARALQPRLKSLVQVAALTAKATALKYDRMNVLGQMQAQATCTALMAAHTTTATGWTFAVQRKCGGGAPTCEQVCGGMKESQAGSLKCFNSLHIYSNKPWSAVSKVGLKTYVYGACGGGCGPNYCCCGGGVKGVSNKAIQPRLNLFQENFQAEKVVSQAVQISGSQSWNRYGAIGQAHAQATCTALMAMHTKTGNGWTFAVMRPCSPKAPTCEKLCAGMVESQAKGLKCFNSLHIYTNGPWSSVAKVGLKTYIYGGCGGGCGPNFCCCGGGVKGVDSRAIQGRMPKL